MALVIGIILWWYSPAVESQTWFYNFSSQELTYSLAGLLLIFSLFLIIGTNPNNYKNLYVVYSWEYFVLFLACLTSLLFVLISNDFLSVYLFVEMQSILLYILVSYPREDKLVSEAGVKYFILGAFGSSLLLFGFSLIYGLTSILQLDELILFLSIPSYLLNKMESGIVIGGLFFISGLLFKLPLVPYHAWAPDVYQGSKLYVTSVLATLPKITIIILILKWIYLVFFNYLAITNWLFFCSLFSIFIGTLSALLQTNLKRLLAYSTISHLGTVMLGFSTLSLKGIQTGLVYLLIYLLLSLNLFLALLCFSEWNSNSNKDEFNKLEDLSLILKSNTLLGFFIAVNFFSFAGIPPLSGFFMKLSVLWSLIINDMLWVSFFILFLGVISCFYYLRIIRIIFFDVSPIILNKPINWNLAFIISFLSFLNIGILFFLKLLLLESTNWILLLI